MMDTAPRANPFDQFDEKPSANPFDQFDAPGERPPIPANENQSLETQRGNPFAMTGSEIGMAKQVPSIGAAMSAFGQGFEKAMDADSLGVSDETRKILTGRTTEPRKLGDFADPMWPFKAFNEGIILPLVTAGQTAWRLPGAIIRGLDTLVTGDPAMAGPGQSLFEAMPTGGMWFGVPSPRLAPPKPFVQPVAIKPIEGSPAAGLPRHVAALTGDPLIDATLQHPVLREVIDNPVVDDSHTIPNSLGGSTPVENPTLYRDKDFPKQMTVDGVTFDTAEPSAIHENVEEYWIDALTKAGMDQPTALKVAFWNAGEVAEDAWYSAHGMNPEKVEAAYTEHLDRIAARKADNVPLDLFDGTYPDRDPHKAGPGPIEKPTPEETARGREIMQQHFDEMPKPVDPIVKLQEARDLGVIGPPKEESAVGDSPSELADQALPRSLSAAAPDTQGRPPPGHKPGEYDARGKEWIDKIDEPDDVRDAIEKIANDHDFFPEARGGVASAAARDAVAEAAGIDPATIDAEYFATHFDSDGKVRAVIQALRQTAKDFSEASERAAKDDPSIENAAAVAEAEMRHTHVLEYTMGLRAESGRTLAAWKDLLREVEHGKAQVAIKAKETTGEVPAGTAAIIDAAKDVQDNLKNADKKPSKKLGLQKLIDQAKELVDRHDATPPEQRASLSPELKGLVDEARKTLKRFGADKDAAEVEGFKRELERLGAGEGKLGDTVEAARELLKKNEKPEKAAEPPKAPSERGKLLGAAKRLVAAADDLAPEAKAPVSAKMRGLMETARQAVGRLRTQNLAPDLAAFRSALNDGDAAVAHAAANRLVESEAKATASGQRPPVEHDVVMAAARRLAKADLKAEAREKPALPQDIKNLIDQAKDAAKDLQTAQDSVLGKLIDQAEQQAVDMVKTKAVKNPVEALPPELQALVDKTKRVVDRFGGTARGERAALLLARTGRTMAEQEQLARSVSGLTPNQVAKVLERLRTSKDMERPGWVFWGWMQGLISGLITHAGYAITNTATVFMERVISPTVAAVIGKARGQDVSVMAPMHSATAMVHSLPDAFVAAGQAFKTGTRVPLASEMRLFERGEESPQTKGANSAYVQSQGPDWGVWKRVFNEDQLDSAARVLGIPGRAANMMHTFFKVLSERASASTIAYETAAKEGVTGDKFWQRYRDHLNNPTDDALRAAVNDAYSGAFMARLGPKTEQAAHTLKNNPVGKWIFPFAHIPWNITRMGLEYSPLAVLGPEMRASLLGEKGAPAQNLAIAKMTVGSSIITYFAYKALGGEATADYPTDQTERRRWQLLGIQPRSIQMGGYWVSLERLGPIGKVAHMGASIGTIIHHYDGQDDDAMTAAIWSSSVAAANVFAADFQGLKNLFDSLQSEKKGVAFASSFAGSFVPSLIGQTASVIDPDMRKAEGLVDGLKYRVPWLRDTILPKLDPLYGEPVPNPGYHSIPREGLVNTDPVKAELDRLKIYPAPPEQTVGGVKLPEHLYFKYQVAAGVLTRQALESWIRQPDWHEMPAFAQEEILRKSIGAARQQAAAAIQADTRNGVLQQGMQNMLDRINGPPGAKPAKLRDVAPLLAQ